ncbi:uncharacterized protein si:ch211-106e7.2 [Hoplias malabaricus]|uniref:uncharacterized protein si:ch211-106e7.2 n=1 Tax=Hoplias malabaricus TaxID=27720 RepID=UPI003463314A
MQKRNRMHDSMPHTIHDNAGYGYDTENVFDHQRILTAASYTKSNLDNSIRHFTQQFGKSNHIACATSTQLNLQNYSMPKDNIQQNYASERAVAVVAPLHQQLEACADISKYSTKANLVCLETRPKKKESLCGNALQTHNISEKMPSELMQETVVCQHSEQEGPAEYNVLSNHSKNVYSYAAAPITKWSFQKLRTLITESEQKQQKIQRSIPFKDISSEIVKLYWDGDYQNFCRAVRSDLFVNIMTDVRLHSRQENSVILKEISKEKLDQDFHILKDDPAPKTLMYKSFNCSTKVAEFELTVEEQKSLQMTENKNSNLPETEPSSQARRQPVPTGQDKSCAHIGKKVLIAEPTNMHIENKGISPIRERHVTLHEHLSETSSIVTVQNCNNVTENSARTEQLVQTLCENQTARGEVLLCENKQSPAISDKCKPENLKLIETQLIDDCGKARATDNLDQIKVLAPETARKVTTNMLNDEAESIQLAMFTKTYMKNDQVKQSDKKHDDLKKKPVSHRNHATHVLEKYCCIAKWFGILGYAYGEQCKCDDKPEQRSGNDVSGKGLIEETSIMEQTSTASPVLCQPSLDDLEITEVISDYNDVLTISNIISEEFTKKPLNVCGGRSFKNKKKYYRHNADGNKRTLLPPCGWFASKADLIPSLSNAALHTNMALPLSSAGHTNFQCDEKREVTSRFQKEGRLVNLVLYGSSSKMQKRTLSTHCYLKNKVSGMTYLNKLHFPPATINVRVSPQRDHANSSRNQTNKQRILKSLKNRYVPTKMSIEHKSSKLKNVQEMELKTDDGSTSATKPSTFSTTFDLKRPLLVHPDDKKKHGLESVKGDVPFSAKQQKDRPASSSDKRRHVIRKKKLKKGILASINPAMEQNGNKSKPTDSSFGLHHSSGKNKQGTHRGLALDFKVLPESFNFKDGINVMESDQSVHKECKSPGLKCKTENLRKKTGVPGVWCVSPRKKVLKSAQTSDVSRSSSMFQEFKKKFEDRKQLAYKSCFK